MPLSTRMNDAYVSMPQFFTILATRTFCLFLTEKQLFSFGTLEFSSPTHTV